MKWTPLKLNFFSILILLSFMNQASTMTEKRPCHKKAYDYVRNILGLKSAPANIRVYHCMGRGGTIDSVREHGLMTFNELFKRGLIKDDPSQFKGVLPDQYDVIYFTYNPDLANNQECVGFEVDPETMSVYNREFRFDRKNGYYQNSKVLLADYLIRYKKAQDLRDQAPQEKAVIFNPMTAEPFYVDKTDERYYDKNNSREDEGPITSRHYHYWNEIIIQGRNCIPPEELFFPGASTNLSDTKE